MDMTALSAGNVANRNAVAAKAQKESNRKLAIRATVGIVLLSLVAWFFAFSSGMAFYTLLAVLSLVGAKKAPVPGLILTAVFGIIALSYYGGAVEAHRFAALTPEQQAAEIAAKKAQEVADAQAKKIAEAAAEEREKQEAKRDAAERIAKAEREKWGNAIWAAKQAVTAALKDPDSAQFGEVVAVSADGEAVACGSVNAKNSFGGYTGQKSFVYAAGLLAMEGEKGFSKLWNTLCANKPIQAKG